MFPLMISLFCRAYRFNRTVPFILKYSMIYIRDGNRVFGYDNHVGKGDHRHYGDKEEPYKFTSIDKLFEDFYKDLRRFKKP